MPIQGSKCPKQQYVSIPLSIPLWKRGGGTRIDAPSTPLSSCRTPRGIRGWVLGGDGGGCLPSQLLAPTSVTIKETCKHTSHPTCMATCGRTSHPTRIATQLISNPNGPCYCPMCPIILLVDHLPTMQDLLLAAPIARWHRSRHLRPLPHTCPHQPASILVPCS